MIIKNDPPHFFLSGRAVIRKREKDGKIRYNIQRSSTPLEFDQIHQNLLSSSNSQLEQHTTDISLLVCCFDQDVKTQDKEIEGAIQPSLLIHLRHPFPLFVLEIEVDHLLAYRHRANRNDVKISAHIDNRQHRKHTFSHCPDYILERAREERPLSNIRLALSIHAAILLQQNATIPFNLFQAIPAVALPLRRVELAAWQSISRKVQVDQPYRCRIDTA